MDVVLNDLKRAVESYQETEKASKYRVASNFSENNTKLMEYEDIWKMISEELLDMKQPTSQIIVPEGIIIYEYIIDYDATIIFTYNSGDSILHWTYKKELADLTLWSVKFT